MTLAMNMAKTSQSCLEDFVKTKFRKIMLPQKQGNTHHTCFDFTDCRWSIYSFIPSQM